MKLRPHHILCIGKFTGHGYNESFTRHMRETAALLRSSQDTVVTLVFGPDELCRYCRNNSCGVCTSEDKVKRLDRDVAEACSLSEGDALWSELCRRAHKYIYGAGKFDAICSRCEWYGLCASTEAETETNFR